MSTATLLPADNAGMPTFAQAKTSKAMATVAGYCTNSDEFTELVNEGTERLMIRGDWPGTEVPILITIHRGIVTFPRYVSSVRALNVCNGSIPVWGDWYRFLPYRYSRGTCCGSFSNWIGSGWRSPSLSMYGTGVQFDIIPTPNCVLKVYSGVDDIGKIIQFFGVDPAGNPLRTDNGDGTWSDGISITLNQPFTVDTNLVQFIQRSIKPVTQQSVQISALDQVTGTETPIAQFDAGDTNPWFVQYRLQSGLNCQTTAPVMQAVALVKLKFIPVVANSDIILIPSLHALKLFIQGIKFGEAGDRQNSLLYQADAVKELNLVLQDTQPEEQIPVLMNPFGTADPWRAGVGRII